MTRSYTLAVIKPGAVSRRHVGHILKEASKEGLHPVAMEMQHWSRSLAEEFYAEHKGKPFFGELIEHATSGPCVAAVLESDDNMAVFRWRNLMGPANPSKGIISEHLRTAYGTRMPDNAVHGSDRTEAAKRETQLLFSAETAKLFFDDVDAIERPRNKNVLKFKILADGADICRGTPSSAGLDLYATEDVVVKKGEIATIKTGLAVEIPERHFGLVAIRSGLGTKHGINLANAPGIIDSDYRGEIVLKVMSACVEECNIAAGDRVAQLVVIPFYSLTPEEGELSETERGTGGFGSTGK